MEENYNRQTISLFNNFENVGRISILNEPKKKKYISKYNSKWANLKYILQDKSSLEFSIEALRKQTIDKFAIKCQEIYKNKIKCLNLQKSNSQIILNKNINNLITEIKILDGITNLNYCEQIQYFLFKFRENNLLMLNLIDNLKFNEEDILVPFFCHFFYENFYMESTEQEEIVYIIYLLLEKEIDNLFTPAVNSFLDESFIGKFLYELSYRNEIKLFLNTVLNSLIIKLENINFNYYSLEIINKTKIDNNSISNSSFSNLELNKSLNTTLNSSFKSSNSKFETNEQINKDNINKDINEIFNDCELRKKLEEETNILKRELLLKHLRYIKSSKNKELFSNNEILSKINKSLNYISKESINNYNLGYELIKNFIDDFFTNLNNVTIIPYLIKIVCKIIYVLVEKKFKDITTIQKNSLVCEFFFGKIIFPIILNPDINETEYNSMISLNTRKNLNNIYLVLKKLTRGEFFASDNYHLYTIFNKYIYENIYKVDNFIQKIINNVKLPKKLEILSEQFYKDDNFILTNEEREFDLINYDYFEENKNDFMQHQSICFSLNELLTILSVVKRKENSFFELIDDEKFKDSYKQISEFEDILNQTKKPNQYFVLINDHFQNEIKELLNTKENNIQLNLNIKYNNYLEEIKFCISYLLTGIEILPHWKWVTDNLKTEKCFESIYDYLSVYEKHNYFINNNINVENNDIPLSWYGLFVKNNIEKISNDYKINDYQLLFNEIFEETRNYIKQLKKLNEFLTVQMTTKFNLLDHKIKIAQLELENLLNCEINIKSLLFIETQVINVCLIESKELNNIQKYSKNSINNINTNNILKLYKEEQCPYKQYKQERYYYEHIKKSHSNNINDFAEKFCDQNIIDGVKNDIMNAINNPSEFKRNINAHEILESYMTIVMEYIKSSYLFKENEDKKENEVIFVDVSKQNENNEKKNYLMKIKYEKIRKNIWNYILKKFCKIYENNSFEIDRQFNEICKSYSWIDPIKNLDIPENIYNQEIFELIFVHIKNMDILTTPIEKLNSFGTSINLINSLFKLAFNKKAEADNFLSVIIYALIKTQPKRINWNVQFIKYFLNQKELFENNGYNLTQIESSILYIKTLTYDKLHLKSEKELEDKCKEALLQYK